MPAARGDTKPCSIADCTGTMRYGRRLDNVAVGARNEPRPSGDEKGWVCSLTDTHFRLDDGIATR